MGRLFGASVIAGSATSATMAWPVGAKLPRPPANPASERGLPARLRPPPARVWKGIERRLGLKSEASAWRSGPTFWRSLGMVSTGLAARR